MLGSPFKWRVEASEPEQTREGQRLEVPRGAGNRGVAGTAGLGVAYRGHRGLAAELQGLCLLVAHRTLPMTKLAIIAARRSQIRGAGRLLSWCLGQSLFC